MASNYPAAVDDQSTLLNPVDARASNKLETLTAALVLSGDSTIQVQTTLLGFAAAHGVLSIEDELVIYTGKTVATFTGCVRGAFGTTAVGHALGVWVRALMVAGYLKRLQEAVIATQQTLGIAGNFSFVGSARQVLAGTGLEGGGDLSADRTLSVIADTTIQRLEVSKAGALIGTRKRVNLIQGANVTLTVTDDAANNEVDVTIAASGGGGLNYIRPTVPPPVISTWTALNQDAAVMEDFGNGVRILVPVSTAAGIRAVKRTAPSTPYTITAAFHWLPSNVDGAHVCIGWRQSSDGKLALACWRRQAAPAVFSTKYTNATTFSADYTNHVVSYITQGPLMWLRIADNGTNRLIHYSTDGYHWVLLHSVSRTDFLTPDENIFGIDTNAGAAQCHAWLLSWDASDSDAWQG